MAKVFCVDVARCTGCYNCQLVCKDEHCDNDWRPYAAPQPKTGHFWCKLEEHVCGSIPKVRIHYIVHMCAHCRNPACVKACQSGAYKIRDDGLILIDPEKCKGCKACVSACPYGAVYFNEELGISQKCTGCAHLLDNGFKLPRCVDACPTDALQFGEEDDLEDLIRGATVLKPEEGSKPRIYYRNIPGKFIAGTVYDPDDEVVIIGARCHLSRGPKVWNTNTDHFGDFWFKDLPEDKFDLIVEAEGFERKEFAGLDTVADINLGDIALQKKT